MSSKTASVTCDFLHGLATSILNGNVITLEEAQRILFLKTQEEIVMLIAHANMIRNHFKGSRIDLCAVVNAKSGKCSEDCIFCAQSAHYETDVKTYPLLDTGKIVDAAEVAKRDGAHRFGIVTSGKGITSDEELGKICKAISDIAKNSDVVPCASLGVLESEQCRLLSDAGLTRYHHNLETAESYFPSICSTHTYDERVQTVRMLKEEGFEVCSGGIFGLGEAPEQRIELAFALKELDVDSVPINFLNPVAGTPAEKYPLLSPHEILKTIALFRFVLPEKDIRMCGGRERSLRTLQPLMYLAGANATMVGNYLTTSGRDSVIDLQEIMDLGLTADSKG